MTDTLSTEIGDVRNAVLMDPDTIECEWCHPRLGFILFTATRTDVEVHGRYLFHTIKDAGFARDLTSYTTE